MDAVELPVLVEELEALHVDSVMARIGLDDEIRHRRDEALFQLLEVARIGEGEIGGGPLEGLDRVARGGLALGVEMAFERLWGRGSRGGLTKLHRTKREGGLRTLCDLAVQGQCTS